MKLSSWTALWIVAACGVARAAAVDTTFEFSGYCSDCREFAEAQLVLQNYTLGDPIDASNCVSFVYDGTVLASSFIIEAENLGTIGGVIDGPLPAPEDFYISSPYTPNQPFDWFVTEKIGDWCLGTDCLGVLDRELDPLYYNAVLDYGYPSEWSIAAIPEPPTATLIGLSFFGLQFVRRRRGSLSTEA